MHITDSHDDMSMNVVYHRRQCVNRLKQAGTSTMSYNMNRNHGCSDQDTVLAQLRPRPHEADFMAKPQRSCTVRPSVHTKPANALTETANF